jgi:putative transposase
MPRSARVVIANQPHHIVQRGHNRQTVFAHADDYRFYLSTLKEWKENLRCKVYAYCLMTNHVHLVIEPCGKAENLGLLMKRVAGRYTRYINKKEGRTGTVWEGRYKSSPVDTGEYLLACCRYVEMNPVRAGAVLRPDAYRWSSYGAKAGIAEDAWLDLDGFYLGLGRSATKRQERYRQWMAEAVSDEEAELIRQAARRNQLTGGNRFIDEIEKKMGTRIELRGRGRPANSTSKCTT